MLFYTKGVATTGPVKKGGNKPHDFSWVKQSVLLNIKNIGLTASS